MPRLSDAGTHPLITLAITTYERPDALAAVLATVARQSSPPDELIVADDGSGADTREVCEGFSATTPLHVHYVRQDHEGFRLARLRNLATARTSNPYIVFIDGDMLLHPHFIADHRRIARRGYFTQGVRIPISAPLTAHLLSASLPYAPASTSPRGSIASRSSISSPSSSPSPGAVPLLRAVPSLGTVPTPASRGLGFRRRAYALHAPRLTTATRHLANPFIAIKGCNQAFWREDLVAVNGFNEDFVGWGPEDKEIAARLQRHGTRRQTLLFGGIAFHLHHPPAERERRTANEHLLADTRARRLARCEHGLEAHLRVL
jgi:glycosyltransferase involved in cell wall biosynthesis